MRKPTKEVDEYIRENLRYDPETGYLWWIKESDHRVGKKRDLDKSADYIHKNSGYVNVNLSLTGGQFPYRAHRVAWFLHYGSWPDKSLDHINGIKTDNRIENLRPATQQENDRNRKAYKGCSSKYKGVSWSKSCQKWKSYIRSNQRQEHLGIYSSEEEAAQAYDKAARERFGDYACLNFPEEHEQGAIHGHDV